jgi:hypothetical protein
MDLRASDGGDQRRGSTGKQATMDADLNGGNTTGVVLGDDEGNHSRGSPCVFLALAQERLKAGDQGADLGARGGVAAGGVNDEDGGCPKRIIPSFSLVGCPQK